MDVKALAKSKRSHTQHHSKRSHGNHHRHKLKSQSPSSSSSPSNDAANKPLGKQQVNEKKSHRSRSQGSSALPTNWDRYEEEEEEEEGLGFGSEGVSHESANKTLDVIMPKSKGADFHYLVAEAQSHAETSLEGFPSLDDSLPEEFGVGLSSMLAVRGEGILSWIGDDNFVVEDKPSGNQEASLISLNLRAIAENLAKVDLSKRLFIEPDLLPIELQAEELAMESNEEPVKQETTADSELANRMSKELNLDDFTADQFASSTSASTFAISDDTRIPVNFVDDEFQQVARSGKNKAILSSAEANIHSTEDTRGKQTEFEAAAAEEELDMLLDSLHETKILEPPHLLNKESIPSKVASSLDDALDDLLEETSTMMNPNVLLRPQEEKRVSHSTQSSSHSGSKSKALDDFDSWFDTL